MNKLRSIFLLILSVFTGFEASSGVKGCQGGWVDYTCQYPDRRKNHKIIEIKTEKTPRKINKTNEWEESDSFYFYHDTKTKTVRWIKKDLTVKDKGTYTCQFDQQEEIKNMKKVKVLADKNFCQTENQTVHITAKTTIRCDYPSQEKSKIYFICKDNNFTCEEILSTSSSKRSNRTLTLSNTSSGFSVFISNVSFNDNGVYWCGVKETDGRDRAGLKKIQIKVTYVVTFRKSPAIGQNLTFYCKYEKTVKGLSKFVCKGEDPSSCQIILNTSNPDMNQRFSVKKEKDEKFTITVREVTAADSGTYWCGAENTDGPRSKIFTHKFQFFIPVIPTTPASQSAKPPAPSTPASPSGGLTVNYVIVGVVIMLLLLLPVASILIYKRYLHSKSSKSSTAEQQPKEEYIYEEIPECFQTKTTTVYATANFPTNNPSSVNYSTINFPSSSADGDVLMLRPGSTSCQYSVLKGSQSSTSLTDQPSRSTNEPLYSTIKKPQEE